MTTPSAPVAMGAAASIQLAFSDPGSADKLSASVTWGDGATTTSVSGGTVTHSYAAAGSYLIRVTVRDNAGATASRVASAPIIIFDPSVNPPDPGYEAIDLGTLGGNSAVPLGLNDNGQVVGYSTTGDGRQHAFIWENGEMRDLGLGFDTSAAQVITNSGVIGAVGYKKDLYPYAHVIVWNNGVVNDFGPVWGSDELLTFIGITGPADFAVHSTASNSGAERGAVWQNGIKQNVLGPPPGLEDRGGSYSVNLPFQVVGRTRIGDFGGELVYHPFVWKDGVMTELPLLGNYPCGTGQGECASGVAVDINNRGVAIGRSAGPDRLSHGVVWSNGAVTDLGFAWPVAINDAGEVAGRDDYPGRVGYFWRNGLATQLGSLGGGGAFVVDLNDQGIVVGSSKTTSGRLRVFVWTSAGGMKELGAGPAAGDDDAAQPVAINARGDVIGYSTTTCTPIFPNPCSPTGPTRAVLWRRK